ncbi:MAG: bifunctional phosphopantothenoylcysteine decarboxylase/phosphopantothenate--cysteine ligase CoaBC [Bacteroidales bacterium]|nr:bifunctional phosphopantothenoylcysteine decarboxylase/phosphopantothenate--cysteine ligase CoaBC [Bacteroidales bacterium]
MNIAVGLSGGIAAYKVPELIRLLKNAGHEVRCAATAHALQFVGVATLETVSQNPLYTDLFASGGTEHIRLRDWADLLIVAPATANIIGKMASGIADDALSTLLLAMPTNRVVLAPAMNSQMWMHPAVQRNIATLRSWDVQIVGPCEGALACGSSGIGRMAEPADIAAAIASSDAPLAGQHWLVTAGPTYERIDAVRYIGNYSSGKMGYALAEALAEAGAEVVLVSGPTALTTHHPRIVCHRVESAQQMHTIATREFPQCQGAILAAAVADYRPEQCAPNKLKKQGTEGLTLHLVQNPDILATLGQMKTDSQTLVGFALETDNELANAQAKLTRKNLDYIVLNSLRDPGAGFSVDTNKVLLLGRTGRCLDLPLQSKREVARQIVATIALPNAPKP